jgi:hypothetical protein
MAALGFELCFRLVWGSLLVLIFVSRLETSERFVKIAAHIAAGIAAFMAAVFLPVFFQDGGSAAAWNRVVALALLSGGFYLYAYVTARWARILGTSALVLSPWFMLREGLLVGPQLPGLNFIASALLLGGFFGGQYLGHWFLNVPGMHIRELKRVMALLWLGLGLKTAEVLGTLVSQWGGERGFGIDPMGRPLGLELGSVDALLQLNPSQSLFAMQGDGWFGLGFYGLLVLAMRVLWGLGAPWILAWMIHSTVRMRSTQSATGILYAACVMVLVGESAGLYLARSLGWNL